MKDKWTLGGLWCLIACNTTIKSYMNASTRFNRCKPKYLWMWSQFWKRMHGIKKCTELKDAVLNFKMKLQQECNWINNKKE